MESFVVFLECWTLMKCEQGWSICPTITLHIRSEIIRWWHVLSGSGNVHTSNRTMESSWWNGTSDWLIQLARLIGPVYTFRICLVTYNTAPFKHVAPPESRDSCTTGLIRNTLRNPLAFCLASLTLAASWAETTENNGQNSGTSMLWEWRMRGVSLKPVLTLSPALFLHIAHIYNIKPFEAAFLLFKFKKCLK